MNKLVGILCFLLVVFCSCQQEEQGFIVEGEITGWETDSLNILADILIKDRINQTIKLIDGKFQIEGTVKEPTHIKIWTVPADWKGKSKFIGSLYVSNNYNYKVNIVGKEFNVITEDPNQKIWKSLTDMIVEGKQKLTNLNIQGDKIGKSDKSEKEKIKLIDDLRDELFIVSEDNKKAQLEAIHKHRGCVPAVDFFYYRWSRHLRIRQTQKIAKQFTGEAKASLVYSQLATFVFSKTEIREGKPAPDFTVYGMDGKPETFLSNDGKLNLIYFFYPDNKSPNPYWKIRALYGKFKGRQINFKAVIMNPKGCDWIRKMQYADFPIPVYGGDGNRITGIYQTYGVNSTPSLLLIDTDGKIIQKNSFHSLNWDEVIENAL